MNKEDLKLLNKVQHIYNKELNKDVIKVDENKMYLVNNNKLTGYQINQIKAIYNQEKNNVYIFTLNGPKNSSSNLAMHRTVNRAFNELGLLIMVDLIECILNNQFRLV